ncbi:hypothetical protein PG991_011720 [Apiospora marii]|uniref:C2H2-type domain-containing protein n=1 Tax=Apiospora marii TaxID=335849 RepID=A0ABR1RG07_9PEZI
MKIETQPPTMLQAGVAMKQRLAISDAQYDFLHAVLVGLPGEVVAGTSEPVTSPNAGRASFLDLTISGLGQYKIHVDAYTIDYQRSDCPMRRCDDDIDLLKSMSVDICSTSGYEDHYPEPPSPNAVYSHPYFKLPLVPICPTLTPDSTTSSPASFSKTLPVQGTIPQGSTAPYTHDQSVYEPPQFLPTTVEKGTTSVLPANVLGIPTSPPGTSVVCSRAISYETTISSQKKADGKSSCTPCPKAYTSSDSLMEHLHVRFNTKRRLKEHRNTTAHKERAGERTRQSQPTPGGHGTDPRIGILKGMHDQPFQREYFGNGHQPDSDNDMDVGSRSVAHYKSPYSHPLPPDAIYKDPCFKPSFVLRPSNPAPSPSALPCAPLSFSHTPVGGTMSQDDNLSYAESASRNEQPQSLPTELHRTLDVEVRYACWRCDKTCTDVSDLKRHNCDVRYTCGRCDKTYTEASSFKRHDCSSRKYKLRRILSDKEREDLYRHAGMKHADIAAKFGIVESTVSRILKRKHEH